HLRRAGQSRVVLGVHEAELLHTVDVADDVAGGIASEHDLHVVAGGDGGRRCGDDGIERELAVIGVKAVVVGRVFYIQDPLPTSDVIEAEQQHGGVDIGRDDPVGGLQDDTAALGEVINRPRDSVHDVRDEYISRGD